jgi:hypothetical protein
VQVPLCNQCRRDMRLRDVGIFGAGVAAGALALGLWYVSMPKLSYLAIGAVLAVIVFFVVAVALESVFRHKRLAYLEPDGSDITFANPEYQRIYTGASRPGREKEVDWGELNWK